jgi:hypothetical protein
MEEESKVRGIPRAPDLAGEWRSPQRFHQIQAPRLMDLDKNLHCTLTYEALVMTQEMNQEREKRSSKGILH